MEKQTTSQPTKQTKKCNIVWVILIFIIALAIIVSISDYLSQSRMIENTKFDLQIVIENSQNKISETQK